MSNKPGSKLPEAAKRSAYNVTSRAIALCQNAQYVEVEDFEERSTKFWKEIEAKRKEIEDLEEAMKQTMASKCFIPTADGGYRVGLKGSNEAKFQDQAGFEMTTSSAGSHEPFSQMSLSAKEISAQCSEDPEALWLGGVGMRDSDIPALLEALKKSGLKLTSIDLSRNLIADTGVQKLVTALAGGACPNLKELWLDGNLFGELGARILTDGLRALRKGLTVHFDQGASSGDKTTFPTSGMPSKLQEPIASQDSKESFVEHLDSKLRVRIPLPTSIASSADVELELSSSRLIARSKKAEIYADVYLPALVNITTAQAAFSKRNCLLTVTVDTAD